MGTPNGIVWPPPRLLRVAAATANGAGLFFLGTGQGTLGMGFVAGALVLNVADAATSGPPPPKAADTAPPAASTTAGP
jgi:hypothetical protein